ncbi:MAG: hypothetical protein KBD78_07855 [Oligoflexales bacterium]|nr:hypothetical protein [Oligoflexales bacterium]
MKIKGIFASVLATAIAGSAFAETKTTFQNNLHSGILVSPAQYNQVSGAKTDLSIGFDQLSAEKSGTNGFDAEANDTNLRATGIYSFTNIGLKAGMDVAIGSTTIENNSTNVNYDSSMMAIAPVALYTANDMFTVAMQYTYATEESDQAKKTTTLTEDTQDVSYGIFTPAFLVSMGAWEAGLVYSTEVDEEATNSDDLPLEYAAEWKIHGRYSVMPELALGGYVGQAMWSSFDADAVTGKKEDDQTTVAANAQWTMDALKLEGILAWNSDFYGDNANMSTDNISTIMVEAGADYAVAPTASVGGALAYTTGSDSANNVDYDVNTLGVTVRGNLMF